MASGNAKGAKLTQGGIVMVNFMCQLDWDMGCLDI